VLRNLAEGKFEKLSFLAGTLSGLLERPAEVGKAVRAGSIFMLPGYIWIMAFVGSYQGAEWLHARIGDSTASVALGTAVLVLACLALFQFLALPLRTSAGHAVFRLAVIDALGKPAGLPRLLARWAIVWLPLLVPLTLVVSVLGTTGRGVFLAALAAVGSWIGLAVAAALHPNRGPADGLAGTWVVRR
jgi:hypothetical protein